MFIFNKIYFLETSITLNDGRTVSFHKAWKQPTSLNERESMTELRVICTMAEKWGMPTSQVNGLIPKCRNSEHQDYESICIVQEPKIAQYMHYTVAHNSSATFSTICNNISYLRGEVASMSNTHLLLRPLVTCTDMSWSCRVCVCVCGGGGGGISMCICFFACLFLSFIVEWHMKRRQQCCWGFRYSGIWGVSLDSYPTWNLVEEETKEEVM